MLCLKFVAWKNCVLFHLLVESECLAILHWCLKSVSEVLPHSIFDKRFLDDVEFSEKQKRFEKMYK